MGKKWLKGLLLFVGVFVASGAIIHIDVTASGIIGNDSFFSSGFTRVSQREVEVKIMGFETSLVNGIAVTE